MKPKTILAAFFIALIAHSGNTECANSNIPVHALKVSGKEENYENQNIEFPQSNLDIVQTTHVKSLPVSLPKYLSHSPKKDWLYAQDPFFRIGFHNLQKVCDDPKNFCENYTYLIIKPDGVAARCFDNVVAYLEKNHFKICHTDLVYFDTIKSILFWSYESNFFPVEWFSLISVFFNNQPSIIILIKDELEIKNETASFRLNKLKGDSFEKLRKPFQLRAMLKAGSGFLTFVHTPDDPLSMLREWAIIMDEHKTKEFILNYKNNPLTYQSMSQTKELAYSQTPNHSLDYSEAAKNLEELCTGLPLTQEVKDEFRFIIRNKNINFYELFSFISLHNIQIPHWDLITFCSYRCGDPLPVLPLVE